MKNQLLKKERQSSVENSFEMYFNPTGDPFLDAGGLVLETISKRFQSKTLMGKIEYVTDVYINLWHQKLHSIFHTNSPLMNPATKGKHKLNTLNYFQSLINRTVSKYCIRGYCKICGKFGVLYSNSREFFPISGSGKFINFHHSHERGIFLCNECSIKLYFLPLGVIQLGKNLGLLNTQTNVTKKFWIDRIIKENLNKISKQSSEGILKSKYKNPKNALFHFAIEIINEIEDENHSEFLQLFHFTNFGAAPDCDIYILPNPIFKFLNKVLHHYGKYWNYFVNRHFWISKAKWDIKQKRWMKEKKKEITILSEDDYLNNSNLIYEKLLSNKSILSQLVRVYREHYYKKLEKFPLMIAIYYVKEVLGMKDQQIELIRRIANVVFEISKRENNFKKYLVMLEGAGRAFQLRSALLKIIKANFKNGAKEPLIRLEEYVNYLFPDGQYWGEVRDLLLIHLYEKFHDEGVNVEEIPEGLIEEIEEKPINEI
ncbi:MAG: type I-B CRISPR-associated protein Cas8b1/Cst1 [Promethearchaeota archaeon]